METVVLFIENQRERQVTQIICESYGFNVLALPLETASFAQLLQYRPESIIMEITDKAEFQISFLRQIYAESRTSKIRILCFGDLKDNILIRKITEIGRISYYERPLNTDKIKQVARPKTTKGADLRKDTIEGYIGEQEDTAKIMDPSTSRTDRISIMANKIGELLAFPFTVAKVLAVTQSSTTGAGDLAKAIEIDPVIVSAILKTANSALYGRGGQKISSIKDAIVRIGFTETKSIAVSLSVMLLFSDEENCIGFNREAFWYHSLAVGVIAGKLAKQAGFPHHEIAFVGGLLHDFGVILLDEFYPNYFNTTLRSATQHGTSFLEEQQNRWKMTHNDVVCKLFEKWNMPFELLAPLQYWLKDFNWKHETDRNITILVHSIRVAEIMAHSLVIGKECDEFIESIPAHVAEELKLNRSNEENFFKLVNDEINLFTVYLQMSPIQIAPKKGGATANNKKTISYVDFASLRFDPLEYYLLNQGYQLLYNNSTDEIKAEYESPKCILLRINTECNPAKVTPFTHFISRNNAISELDTEEFVPVLITGPESMRSHFTSLPSHCGFLCDTFDLRILTFSIQRLMLGEPLLLTHSAHENVPARSSSPKPEAIQKPGISTRIFDNNKVLISLQGNISKTSLPELKDLIGKILKKTDVIIFDLSESICDSALIQSLEEFKKAVWTKKIILILCTLGITDATCGEVAHFQSEKELQSHINSLIDLRNSSPQIHNAN